MSIGMFTGGFEEFIASFVISEKVGRPQLKSEMLVNIRSVKISRLLLDIPIQRRKNISSHAGE